MSRSVPEWIGKTDDTPAPPRVKVRVFDRTKWKCAECGKDVGSLCRVDHIKALCNGGENRESNLQGLCYECHAAKTRQDVAEKSKTYAMRMAHFGFRRTTRRLPHGKDAPTKRKITGEVVPR